MLAFTCLPNSYENNAKIAILFRLSSNIIDFFHQDSSFQPFHELQFSLEVLDKSSIISHDSAQEDNLIRGCPFFHSYNPLKIHPINQNLNEKKSRIHKKLKMNIFVIPASQKWLAESCISLWIKEWRFTCWHSSYYGSVLKPLLKKGLDIVVFNGSAYIY